MAGMRYCGIDVHTRTLVVHVLGARGRGAGESRTFGTMRSDLYALRDWLCQLGVSHVAMESTGVYWKPLYGILEDKLTVVVANAQHVKKVPGRKTDVSDAEWLARLVKNGLLRPSFVPAPAIRELRDAVRYRTARVQARSTERNRTVKLLESAGIKLAAVASNVFGTSGMRMLQALARGDVGPAEMAELAAGRLRRKRQALVVALDVPLTATQRTILRIQLDRLADNDRGIAQAEELIGGLLEPYAEQARLLATIPGVDRWVAAAIIAEVGADMTLFGGPHHLAAWAGVVPGSNQSGGRSKTAPSRKGNRFLTAALVMAANAASRTRGTYYRDKFHRLKARRGYKRATIAIARKLIVVAYHVLRDKTPYRELGEHYLDQADRHRTIRRLQRRLEELSGAKVTFSQPVPSSSAPPAGAGPN